MRKRYRDEKRSCTLCKPEKRGWQSRWAAREIDAHQRSEHETRSAVNASGRQRKVAV
jgi:hypothetical protein